MQVIMMRHGRGGGSTGCCFKEKFCLLLSLDDVDDVVILFLCT